MTFIEQNAQLILGLILVVVIAAILLFCLGLLITHFTYKPGTGLIEFVDEKLVQKKLSDDIIIYLTLDQRNIYYRHAIVSRRKENGKNIKQDYTVVEYWQKLS